MTSLHEPERRAPYSVRIPPWAVGAVLMIVSVAGAVVTVDARYVKASEFERHVETTSALYATREQLAEFARLRDEHERTGEAQTNAKLQALTDQVSRLAEIMQAHQALPMHPQTADAFRALEGRFASVEANERWTIEAIQALLRRQGITTPVAPPPAPSAPAGK